MASRMHSCLMLQGATRWPTLRCRLRLSSAVRSTLPRPHAACCILIASGAAGDVNAYLDVLRAAPVLDGRVFVEVFARGRTPAVDDRGFARAAWHAASYINSFASETDAVRCLLETGALLCDCVQRAELTALAQARCVSPRSLAAALRSGTTSLRMRTSLCWWQCEPEHLAPLPSAQR